MKRGGPLERRTPLRSVGKRGRAHVNAMRKARQAAFDRDGHRCRVPLPHDCTGRAEHAHHLCPVGRGGPDHPDNLLSCCHNGHAAIHANPTESTALGLLRRRDDDEV